MDDTLTLRRATLADLGAVDDLLARSYPRLLARDYPPSVLVTAVPRLVRAQPGLLGSGRYHLVSDARGRVLGAGGWSAAARGGRTAARGLAHVRHVATDPAATRRGIGRAIMARVLAEIAAEGLVQVECLSTRTAVPFYAALGFLADRPVSIPLAPGIDFPAVRMLRPV
jgi:GNAT superfamily N-acetyltransferase